MYAGPLTVLAIAIVLFLLEPVSSEYLAYNREAVDTAQWWRFIFANVLHTNLTHLLLNSFGLLLLWALHGFYYSTRYFLSVFFVCSIGTTLGIYFFSSDLIWYVGLSGALHGIFVWGAYLDIKHGMRSGWILMLGLWGKVAYEQLTGPSQSIASMIEADVAIESHLFGAVTGAIIIAILFIGAKINNQTQVKHIT